MARFEAQDRPGAVDHKQGAELPDIAGRPDIREHRPAAPHWQTALRAEIAVGNATYLRLTLVAIAVRQPRTRRSHKINMSRELRPYMSFL